MLVLCCLVLVKDVVNLGDVSVVLRMFVFVVMCDVYILYSLCGLGYEKNVLD